MINDIIEMGNKIEDLWAKVTHNDVAFPDICFEELSNFHYKMELDKFDNEITHWIKNNQLPKQLNIYNTFRQPPLTVFHNGKFVIDLYFWMHVDTSIHSHSFCGAFKVLFGRSLHEQFKVQPQILHAPDIMTAITTRERTELLEGGQTHRITHGNDFSHRIIHLDKPTITLCARTVNDETKQQWHHFPNGISIEKKTIPEDILKKLYFYQYLLNRDEKKGLNFLKGIVQNFPLSVSMNLFEQLSLDSMGLEDSAIQAFFDNIYELIGKEPWFKKYLAYYQRLQEIELDFEAITPELRFLEHAIISEYKINECQEFLEKIHGDKLPQELMSLVNHYFSNE